MSTGVETVLKDELGKIAHSFETTQKEMRDHYDGILKDQEVKQAEKIAELTEKLQVVDLQKQKLEELEAAYATHGFDVKGKDATNPEAKKAFENWIKESLEGGKSSFKLALPEMDAKTLRTDFNPDGGFWLMPEFSRIVHLAESELNPIRSIASVSNSSSIEYYDVLDDEDVVDPLQAKIVKGDEFKPFIDKELVEDGIVSFKSHELNIKTSASRKMVKFGDPSLVESRLQQKIADGIAKREGVLYISGTGASEITGLLSYDAWATPSSFSGVNLTQGTYERGKVDTMNSGVAGGGLTRDVATIFTGALKDVYHGNARWLMNRRTYVAFLLDSSTDNYHNSPTEGVARNIEARTLIGYPVVFADGMPDAATDALSVAFGDFRRAYKVVDFGGLDILRDDITQDKKIEWRVTKYGDAKVVNFDAYKLLKLSA